MDLESLQFNLPPTAPASQEMLKLESRTVSEWVHELPKLNTEKTLSAILDLLTRINRTELRPVIREDIIDVLRPVCEDLLAAMEKKFCRSPFPMSDEKFKVVEEAHRLLAEMVIAYQRRILELFADRDNWKETVPQELQRDAAYCMYYLSLRLVISFSIYQGAPAGVWQDVYRLYHFAEKAGIAKVRVEHLSDESIGHYFRKVVLIALANPNHLMQGEARQLFGMLDKWALACKTLHYDEVGNKGAGDFVANQFYVDLQNDMPPAYGNADGSSSPIDPRVFVMDELISIVENRKKQLELHTHLGFLERMELNLIRRLYTAWSLHQERKEEREEKRLPVMFVANLSSCHFYISGRKPFEPEKGELHFLGGIEQETSELSLVPLDEQDWHAEDVESKIDRGVIKPRSYSFDSQNREDDVWNKATRISHQTTDLEKSLQARQMLSLKPLEQVNQSAGGFGLRCTTGDQIQVRVGELAAIQLGPGNNQKENNQWKLAAIRWLHVRDDGVVDMGVASYADDITPVAVRGLERKGENSDYVPGFLVKEQQKKSLILPAEIFDKDSKVILNMGEEFQVLQLTEVRQATKSFSHFNFQREILDQNIKDAMRKSLREILKTI